MSKPDYITHSFSESDITIDWFFANNSSDPKRKIKQFLLILVGWLMVLLPIFVVVIIKYTSVLPSTGSHHTRLLLKYDLKQAILYFSLFIIYLFILLAVNLYHIKGNGGRAEINYDLLERHLYLAEKLYTSKYGFETLRKDQQYIEIADYADISTFELRQRFNYFLEDDNAI